MKKTGLVIIIIGVIMLLLCCCCGVFGYLIVSSDSFKKSYCEELQNQGDYEYEGDALGICD